ncbi:MAG: histone deacetylase family protein [Desulfurococcales archaeon]|nr:histone deacetylase family protein [Desulfurococcales archaeon]
MYLVWHMYFKMHEPPRGSGHPESPVRLELLSRGLKSYGLWGVVERVSPRLGDVGLFRRVHDSLYIDELVSELEIVLDTFFIDPDTYVSPGTMQAIQALAGAVLASLDLVDSGSVFIAGRPPGHHAGVAGPGLGALTQGFCLVNTAALLADMLAGRGRVAVLDFDVHHGNGTQEILLERPSILHVDLHQDYRTIYPWTGDPGLRGGGNLVNINLPPGAGDDVYMDALGVVEEVLEEWGPEYLVVSAGFDAYRGDNSFAGLRLSSASFHRLGRLASRYRVVAVLEGGYGAGLERGAPAFIAGLLGRDDPVEDEATSSGGDVWSRWEAVRPR